MNGMQLPFSDGFYDDRLGQHQQQQQQQQQQLPPQQGMYGYPAPQGMSSSYTTHPMHPPLYPLMQMQQPYGGYQSYMNPYNPYGMNMNNMPNNMMGMYPPLPLHAPMALPPTTSDSLPLLDDFNWDDVYFDDDLASDPASASLLSFSVPDSVSGLGGNASSSSSSFALPIQQQQGYPYPAGPFVQPGFLPVSLPLSPLPLPLSTLPLPPPPPLPAQQQPFAGYSPSSSSSSSSMATQRSYHLSFPSSGLTGNNEETTQLGSSRKHKRSAHANSSSHGEVNQQVTTTAAAATATTTENEATATVREKEEEEKDEVEPEGIKAMRFGSLGRIIASTTVAAAKSSSANDVPAQSAEERQDFRKSVVSRMMRCLHQSDMNNLAKVIREHFHEHALWITPDLSEPIPGRGDIMMYFSLTLEIFPDGLWNVVSIAPDPVDPDAITCVFRFAGTKLFQFSMDVLFQQIRAHVERNPQGYGELPTAFSKIGLHNSESFTSQKLVNEVTEGCLSVPIDKQHQQQSQLSLQQDGLLTIPNAGNLPSNNSSRRSSFRMPPLSREGSLDSVFSVHNNNNGAADEDDSIHITRRIQSLREVKCLENSVLKEGPTSYRRKLSVVFDDSNRVIRMVATNVKL
jgi:hypothetical protein